MPLPIAFANVTTSGEMPVCSNPNHLPVRAKPVWISSTIIKRAGVVANFAHRAEILRSGGVHPSFTLNRLD